MVLVFLASINYIVSSGEALTAVHVLPGVHIHDYLLLFSNFLAVMMLSQKDDWCKHEMRFLNQFWYLIDACYRESWRVS